MLSSVTGWKLKVDLSGKVDLVVGIVDPVFGILFLTR